MLYNQIVQNEAQIFLPTLPDNCIQTCVTSPPYWGLRDYGLEPSVWGGDPDCQHEWQEHHAAPKGGSNKPDNMPNVGANRHTQSTDSIRGTGVHSSFCQLCGAWKGTLGLEPTPELYIKHIVQIFDEVKRVLRPDGTCWLNIGDSYFAHNGTRGNKDSDGGDTLRGRDNEYQPAVKFSSETLKPKDLCLIPFRLAIALQEVGWWVRSDIIWAKCLSGGTHVYASTQKGEMPVMIRDLARLNPETVELWDGHKWNKVLGMPKYPRQGDEIELVLRDGERISCTPNHKFPTLRGLLEAQDIKVGDILQNYPLPESIMSRDCALDEDAAWLAGLYIAEGSRSGDTIQIAGHAKEKKRLSRLQDIALKYGGHITKTIDGNKMDIRLYGKILNAIIDEFVSGKTAKNKCFSPVVWQYSNKFIESMLDGYLSGDAYWEEDNQRWRLGFTRNYNLERDLRCACARLGYKIILKLASVKYNGKDVPTFRGEIRKELSNHFNTKCSSEVVEIRKARCREVYDIILESEPHTFCLASGIVTHNSNPMPESVKDRPTKSHEYIFLLTKSASSTFWTHRDHEGSHIQPKPDYRWWDNKKEKELDIEPENWKHEQYQMGPYIKRNRYRRYNLWKGHDYYYDADAIREPQTGNTHPKGPKSKPPKEQLNYEDGNGHKDWCATTNSYVEIPGGRNRRTVWNISTRPYPGAHFATFSHEIPELCIKAGSPEKTCPHCGAGWVRIVEKKTSFEGGSGKAGRTAEDANSSGKWQGIQYGKNIKLGPVNSIQTIGWKPSCQCTNNDGSGKAVVLDPFAGSGTTCAVAKQLNRNYIGIEPNPDYCKLAQKRINKTTQQLTLI